MPSLPLNPRSIWPPPAIWPTTAKMTEWSAWYAGDPEQLTEVYGQVPMNGVNTGRRQWWKYWARIANEPESQKAQLHVPIAGDLAAVSGALLFGEEPQVKIKQADGPEAPDAAKLAERRLQDLIIQGGVYNRLVEAAESAAAMGGVYLFPAWDDTVAQIPVINVVQADQAIPEFVYGMLKSVLFWREVEKLEDKTVVRHLELHEPGKVTNALYRGDATYIGNRLSDDQVRSNLRLEPEVKLPFEELDVQYIPNMRPNRLWRKSSLGLSDYSGSEGMFDALDEVYASWMRDIRLGKARIIVPRDFIDEQGAMDVDWEVYQPMDIDPSAAEGGARAMLAQQFAIRYQEHLATALELVERIVSNSGYSPQTFGIRIEGRAESGTALRIRESKTVLTLKRKANWWKPALEILFLHLMKIDAWKFEQPKPDGLEIEVSLNDGIPSDPIELANTANTLKAAKAASTETRVRIVNPHKDRAWIEAEVARINEEEGGAAPTPVVGGQAPEEGKTAPTDQPEDGMGEVVVPSNLTNNSPPSED